ncbi:hypothetical protein Nepgr_026145 [Nepenthes gracilis]|uniref:F-box domain-containing protein n=1 Tax=Nepenthes gracilis TaxID=150966 RepID=A0AAD3T950_NEPGR|nr:hypothetical protein Nepgr_026145 [Nepenthes gracilis]
MVRKKKEKMMMMAAETSKRKTTTANLPADIITEILVRLRVKPLLRFMCVSRSWFDLINSPAFARLHEIQTSFPLLIMWNFYSRQPFQSVDLLAPTGGAADVAAERTVIRPCSCAPCKYFNPVITHPNNYICYSSIVGSSNGILCFTPITRYEKMVLFNPSTRTLFVLPCLPWPPVGTESITFGFGYDPISHDYKLLRITQYRYKPTDPLRTHALIYSLSSNTWREVYEKYTHGEIFIRCASFQLANNALHWVAKRKDDERVIVSFDLHGETYGEVPRPEVPGETFALCTLGVLDGCLCLSSERMPGGAASIWVMKEYMMKDSWVKLFDMADLPDPNAWPAAVLSINGRLTIVQQSGFEEGVSIYQSNVRMDSARRGAVAAIDEQLKNMAVAGVRSGWSHYEAICVESLSLIAINR